MYIHQPHRVFSPADEESSKGSLLQIEFCFPNDKKEGKNAKTLECLKIQMRRHIHMKLFWANWLADVSGDGYCLCWYV